MSRTRRISPDQSAGGTRTLRQRHTERTCYIGRVRCNAVKFALTFFSALLLSTALSSVRAEEPADSKQLRFRRVYAPANRMSDWPTGGGKYLPLETDEFQRLLDAVRTGGAENHGSFSSRITAAEYRAELTGEQALSGRATLAIAHSGESPGMLTLEPISAAVHKTAWDLPGKEANAEIKKPLFGVDSSGKTRVLVEQSGRLIIDWSLAREHDSGEAMEYLCEFPACPVNVLRLDLPKDLTPTSDKGVISSEQSPADGRRLRRIDLGGNSRFHLRLAAAGAGNKQPPPALLSESRIYDFSPRGIELSVQWKIRAHGEPLEKIAVLLDPGLQLAAAHMGEIPATWEIEPLEGDAGSRAVLSLPEVFKDTECILRLDVLAKLNLDRPCRLPRVKPEGLFWQEGVITLIVPDPLVIQRLRPIGCSQTAVGPLPEPRTGESLEFQNFSADATVEITLARRIPHTELVTGTAVDLGAGQIAARVAADLRSDDAGLLTLEADAADDWIIDSVETNPAEMPADWSLENRPGGKRRLFVHLSKAPAPKQALRLAINCRRPPMVPARQWKAGDLLPLRFVNPVETRRLAAVQAGDLYELKLGNAEELTRLAPRDLGPAEQELFTFPPAGLIFEDNAGAAAMEISLGPRKPAFSGSVLVEAIAGKDRLEENFSLRCFPESSGIERVLVQLSQSGKVPPCWTLAGDDEPLSSRQWSKDEQAGAGLVTTGEIWELKLPKPRNEPFEIRGTLRCGFCRSASGLPGRAARGRQPAGHPDHPLLGR